MATASMKCERNSVHSQIWSKFLCIGLVLVSLVHENVGSDCTLGNYNVTLLAKYNPWLSLGSNDTITYKISLCEAVKLSNTENDCPPNTAVCQQTKGEKSISVGNHTMQVNATQGGEEGELIVVYRGEQCPEMKNEFKTTVIYFKCGKSLGSPVFLGSMQCGVYFEWESHVFCTEKNDVPEVPCYLYLDGKKRDLSPLTKASGAYLVDSTDSRQFYINVCRDITGIDGDSSKNCPPGSSACRIINGKGEDMGKPTDRLQHTVDGNLMLQYQTSSKPDGCIDNPTTTITFICPKRGGSKDPLLIDDRLCQNQIEWKTEFACPETTLTSDNCSLTQEQHNIDIDLSPLKNAPASPHPYKMNVTDGSDQYVYVINVCGKLGLECSEKNDNAAACQLKEQHSDFAKNLGRVDRMKLRLSDGELTLSYKDGSMCHTNFRRNTIITFKCNRNAAHNGQGWPVFIKAEECTYFFEWETKYACENHPAQGSCRADYKQQRYDLSALVRESGGNWVALDGENQNEKDHYYINVCKDVLSTSETTGCTSTSVCMIDSSGKAKNLGQFTQIPTYDPLSKTIQINYTDGDTCSPGRKIMSRITFICKPGDLETGPVLIQKTDNECMYEFEWHTAAACVLSKKTGTDCKVFDDDAGYSFDLSQLTKPAGQYYNITDSAKQYDFLLNICGTVSGTKCADTNTATCQVDRNSGSAHKTGEVSKSLIYFDGMLNLTYTNGEPYNNVAHTPRQTQIAFLCNPAAGKGKPEFVVETNYTYSFKWYTAYACPTRPVECVLADKANNRLYDLSRLSMSETQDNWVVLDDSNPNTKRKFYLNICRPVSPVHLSTGGACGPFAAVCETELANGKETLVHASLGEAKKGPVLDGIHPGQIMLKYTGGDPCVDENGKQTTTTTIIHFDCLKGSVSTGPTPLIKTAQCEYSSIWRIEAACPVDDVTSDITDCSIKDPNSDFIFNLKPLMKKNEGFYTANSTDNTRTFRMNICGNVSSTSCDALKPDNVKASVCEHQPTRNPALAMSSNGNLEFSDDGQLTLTYGGKRLVNEQQVQVKIAFVCRRNISVESPVFVRQEDQTYYFKFETALACAPQPVDCVAIDNLGNQYNLNALAKTTSNWMVLDSRNNHNNLKYYINVCRPMNPVAGSDCPGGPVGGCQVGDHSFSLGYVQSKPVVGMDNLILQYRGGSICHKGTARESQRSTRINFICSHVESDPIFLLETEDCEYRFEWSTPSACPQHRIMGTSCKVTDPIYNYQFDLSPLRKQTEDYKVKVDDYTYLINVCGELVAGSGVCAGGTGTGACQTKPGDASYLVNAGQANANVTYDAGELTLRYTNGKGNCHHNFNRTTIITFTCDHSKDGKEGPRYLREDGDCTYQFEWATSYACPPYTVSDCMVTGPDKKVYDLTSLARSDDNYVDNEEYKRKKFVLNVCQTLVHKKGQTCPPNSAACMIDLSESQPEKKFHKIGELSNNPVRIEDGSLIIRYNNGEKCSVGNGTVSTIIIMICDQNAVDSEPGGQYMVNGCEYHFVWTTRAACPVGSQSGSVQSGNCTATNPRTGYTFDLSAFRIPTGYSFDDGNGHEFHINVCGPLAQSPCGKNVASCQRETNGEKRNFSSGIANSNLQYRGGILMLNYSNGDLCHKKYHRATIINFICRKNVGKGQPLLIDESNDCVYQFNWYTSEVCEKDILCSTESQGPKGNFTVDLSPLIKASGHYVAINMVPGAVNPNTTYYINICRPLNPIRGELCPPGSSSCMIVGNNKPVSLGQLGGEPYMDPTTGKVTLLYVGGSKCDADPSKNLSTKIIFICKVDESVGSPKFEGVTDGCEYMFMWYTHLACQENQKEAETPSCTYTNPSTDEKYDISSLNSVVKVPDHSGGYFNIQPCGQMSAQASAQCSGAAVCHIDGTTSMSYGAAKTGTFMMESREVLKLQFASGSDCTDKSGEKKKAKTEILFQCDYSAGNDQPTYLMSDKCSALFLWKTSLICPPVIEECHLVYNNILYDLEILSRDVESWNYTDSKKNIYYLNICQGVHGRARGEGCHLNSAVCRKSPGTLGVDNLGVVNTQKLYMDADGETIVLEYSHGETACSHSRRRSNNPLAKTVIMFKCDKLVGGPKFLEKPENEEKCLFEFEWKTRIACKDGTLAKVVKDKNGEVVDPRSNGVINLDKLSASHLNHAAYEKNSKGQIWYAISIEGKLKLDKVESSAKTCVGAAVCQEKRQDSSYHRNLGTFASRKYYFKDDQLEVVYTSPEKCKDSKGQKRGKNVTTTIIFNCDRHKSQSEPSFSYMSHDCSYVFNWDTDVVCLSPAVEVQTPGVSGTVNAPISGGGGGAGGGIKPKTVVVIISVFLSAIVICVGLIIFHKPDRRAAFASKMKRVFRCNTHTERQIKYSMLSQDDEDPEVDDDFFMDRDNDITTLPDIATLPNTSTDTSIQTTAQVRSYHDSSDDDLLE